MGKVVRLPKAALYLFRCPNDDNLGFLALKVGKDVHFLCAECGEEIEFPGSDVAAPGPADS